MNLEDLLSQLRKERDVIDAVISDLESLAQSERHSPGRPRRSVTTGPMNGTNHGHRSPGPTPRES